MSLYDDFEPDPSHYDKEPPHIANSLTTTKRQTILEPTYKILHIRRQTSQYRDPDQYGGMTIAYSWNKTDSFIRVATAICSIQDKFVKSVGSSMAVENLASGKCVTIPYTKPMQMASRPAEFLRDLFSKPYENF
jgi:hypothetical protein